MEFACTALEIVIHVYLTLGSSTSPLPSVPPTRSYCAAGFCAKRERQVNSHVSSASSSSCLCP